jgi:predicted ABC-type ATPase
MKKDFAFETTLATRHYVRLINMSQLKGYSVTLVFFWLNSPQLAIERVKTRVMAGGHNIQKDVVLRRYNAGISNLSNLYLPICNYWFIFDNSEPSIKPIAEGSKKEILKIYNQDIYNQIVRSLL